MSHCFPNESYAQKMGSQTCINPSAADEDTALSVKKILKTADYACSQNIPNALPSAYILTEQQFEVLKH